MTSTKMATFVYPEEIALRGAAALVGDLISAGVRAVNLAVLYHPARRVLPRYRRVSLAGPVHLAVQLDDASGSIAAGSRPDQATNTNVLEFRDLCRDAGIEFWAWLVLLHVQPKKVGLAPFASTYLDGSASTHSLCPSWEDVRREVASFCGSVVDIIEPDGVLAEAVLYPGWSPDYSLTLGASDLSDAALAALSVCLCDACSDAYGEAGMSVDHLRTELVATAWDTAHDMDPEILAELSIARQAVTSSLIEDMNDAIGAAQLRLAVFGEPADAAHRGWSSAASDRTAGTLVGVGELSGSNLHRVCGSWRAHGAQNLSFSVNWSLRHSGQDFSSDVAWLADSSDEVAVYNFSMLPDEGVRDLALAASMMETAAMR